MPHVVSKFEYGEKWMQTRNLQISRLKLNISETYGRARNTYVASTTASPINGTTTAATAEQIDGDDVDAEEERTDGSRRRMRM